MGRYKVTLQFLLEKCCMDVDCIQLRYGRI